VKLRDCSSTAVVRKENNDDAMLSRLWLFPASPAQRQQQTIGFEDFLPSKDAVIQDLVVDINKKLGQKHINGTLRVKNGVFLQLSDYDKGCHYYYYYMM